MLWTIFRRIRYTVLVENKIFGINIVKNVINGKHYSHGKRGMMLRSHATNCYLNFRKKAMKNSNIFDSFTSK